MPAMLDLPLTQLPPVLDAAQAAQIMRCSQKTAEEMLRDGELPGVKWGEGWALPTRAFIERLNELALDQMLERCSAKVAGHQPPRLVSVQPGASRRVRRTPLPAALQQAIG
jgi:excisionase family DNA binding protein